MAVGRFREALYYRLNVVRIHLPPLRERRQDLDALAVALLERAVKRSGRAVTLSPEALVAIRAAAWPGNVRQLENAIERAVVLSPDGVIRADAFQVDGWTGGRVVNDSVGAAVHPSTRPPVRLKAAVDAAERAAIQAALAASGGNRVEAARLLGISQRNLFYKLKKLGLE